MNIDVKEIRDIPFIYNKKTICKKQCQIYIDGKDNGIYGYPTEEEIYESVKVNKEISFPNCLIPEFFIHPDKLANKEKRIELIKIDLIWSIFNEHQYHFSNIDINGIVNFRGAQFINAHCLLNNCNFEVKYKGNPTIDFTSIECYRSNIKFNLNIIDSHLDFTGSRFQESTIEFDKMNIQHLTNNVADIQVNLRFYAASLDNRSRIRIISSKIQTELDFRLYDWQGEIDLVNVDLDKCKHIDFWTNSINGIFDAFGLSKQLVRCVNNSTIDSKNVDSNILLMLKNSFNKLGYFDDEDNLYVAFRRCQAKAKLAESKKKGFIKKISGFPIYFVKWLIFDLPGEYGTRLGNVVLTMLNTVLFFSFLYYSFPSLINFKKISYNSNEIWNKLAGSIYHSIITFLTIGYGDVAPNSFCGGVLSGFEGFLGLFLMAYITIAFSRKVLR